jgi:hypothetical protein
MTTRLTSCLLAIAATLACGRPTSHSTDTEERPMPGAGAGGTMANSDNMDVTELSNELIEADYMGLFMSSAEYSPLERLWASGKNRDALEALLRDETRPMKARFLAAEVLFAKVDDFPPAGLESTLARIYADALKNTGARSGTYGLPANHWGMLYELDDASPLGRHFISLGEAALPALIDLLDEEEGVLYAGSREATVGNERGYRIKDIAAYYVSQIKGIPIQYHRDVAERDREIERLRGMLGR